MSNFVEIIPDLWLGDDKSVFENISNYKNLDFLYINCNKDLDFLDKSKKYKDNEIKNNLEKYELIKLYKYLHANTTFIYENIKNNKTVIIHCNNCLQKSPTIAAAYLIKYGNLDPKQAINIIKTKNILCFKKSINFLYVLDKFYSDLYFKNQIYNY